MQILETKFNKNKSVLALGAESAGNFSVFWKGKIYFSEDFGDLLEDTNFNKYKHELKEFLQKNKIKPTIILTDLHPLYETTALGQKLAKKYKAKHIQIQHHLAHIFSAIGDRLLQDTRYKIQDTNFGIAMDGTGYGTDGKIWGGEIFNICKDPIPTEGSDPSGITRIGHLENQTLISGDLAIQEPARVLMAILAKFLPKKRVYEIIKNVSYFNGRRIMTHFVKTYSKQEFEVLYNQLHHNSNCQETSSTGRILDAVAVLLGFAGNRRDYKHEAAELLEKNSGKPYADLKPKIIYDKKENLHVLQTTPIFEYLIKNIKKDKKRLAATAQLYIAQGLYEILKRCHPELDSGSNCKHAKITRLPLDSGSMSGMTDYNIFLAGGIANNKIISAYLEAKGAYKNKATPVGDAGLSFGQIAYFLTATASECLRHRSEVDVSSYNCKTSS